MSDQNTVIYTARTMQDAHLLQNVLSEAGIRALVVNDLLQGGSGVDLVGWATSARVVVAASDALRAREMALEFDRRAVAAAADNSPDEEPGAPEPAPQAAAPWPTCPQCQRRRTTWCPVCKTAGSEFPSADLDFSGLLGLSDDAPPHACSCGAGGCTPADMGEAGDETEVDKRAPPVLLMCPTCDEPFVPRYPRRCEWCGHQFEDGFDGDLPGKAAADEQPFDARVAVVIAAILVLLAAMGGWFFYLFGGGSTGP